VIGNFSFEIYGVFHLQTLLSSP